MKGKYGKWAVAGRPNTVSITPEQAFEQMMLVFHEDPNDPDENLMPIFTGIVEVPKTLLVTEWQKKMRHDYSYFILDDPKNIRGKRTLLTPTQFFDRVKKIGQKPMSVRELGKHDVLKTIEHLSENMSCAVKNVKPHRKKIIRCIRFLVATQGLLKL